MANSSTTDPLETVPFGPMLLGQTEKTLQALLRATLADTGLSEPQWVTLRIANLLDGQVDRAGLISAVSDRAKFADAPEIVAVLTERGLVADGKPTDAGRHLVTSMLASSDRTGRGTSSPNKSCFLQKNRSIVGTRGAIGWPF